MKKSTRQNKGLSRGVHQSLGFGIARVIHDRAQHVSVVHTDAQIGLLVSKNANTKTFNIALSHGGLYGPSEATLLQVPLLRASLYDRILIGASVYVGYVGRVHDAPVCLGQASSILGNIESFPLPIDGWSTWAHGPTRRCNLRDQFDFPQPLKDFVLGDPIEDGEVMGLVCAGVGNPAMIVFFYKDTSPYLTIKSINPETLAINWTITEPQRDGRASDLIPYKPHIIGDFFYHHQQWDSEYFFGFPRSKFVCRHMSNGTVAWRYQLYAGSGLPGSFHVHENQLGFPLEWGEYLVLASIIAWDNDAEDGQNWYFDILVLDPATASAGVISSPKLFSRTFLSIVYDVNGPYGGTVTFPKDYTGGPCVLISDGDVIVAKVPNGEDNVFDKNQSIIIAFRLVEEGEDLTATILWQKGGTTEIVPGDGTFGDGDVFDWERPISVGNWDTTAIIEGYIASTDAWLALCLHDSKILAAQRTKTIVALTDRHTINLAQMWDNGHIEEADNGLTGWLVGFTFSGSGINFDPGTTNFFSATGPSLITSRVVFRSDAKWVYPSAGPVRKFHKLALTSGNGDQTVELPSSLASTNSDGREYIVRGGTSHELTQHALTSTQITMTAPDTRKWRYGYHEPLEINLGSASSWVREPTSLEDYQQNLWLLSFQQLEDLSNEAGNLPNLLCVFNSRQTFNSETGTYQWSHCINRRLWLGVNPAIVYWVDGSTTEGGGPRWVIKLNDTECAVFQGRMVAPLSHHPPRDPVHTSYVRVNYIPVEGDLFFNDTAEDPITNGSPLYHMTPFGTYDTGVTFLDFGGPVLDFGGHRVTVEGGDLKLHVGNWFWAAASNASGFGFPAAFTQPSGYTISVAKCPGAAIPIQVENPDLIDDRGKIDRDVTIAIDKSMMISSFRTDQETNANKLIGMDWAGLEKRWALDNYEHFVGNTQMTEPRKLIYHERLVTVAKTDSAAWLLELSPNEGTIKKANPLLAEGMASHYEKLHILPAGGRIFLSVGDGNAAHNIFEGFLGHTKLRE